MGAITKYNEIRGKLHDDDEATETTLYDVHRSWDSQPRQGKIRRECGNC